MNVNLDVQFNIKKYLVFWVNNLRVGSIEYSEHNLKEANRIMHLSLIQRDATGTEHYEVLRVR